MSLTRIWRKWSSSEPAVPLICNTDAQPLSAARRARRHLVDHLTHPVRFEQSVQALVDQGAAVFAEVGFGGVLVEPGQTHRPQGGAVACIQDRGVLRCVRFRDTPRIRNST